MIRRALIPAPTTAGLVSDDSPAQGIAALGRIVLPAGAVDQAMVMSLHHM
jgi:hypothetical protein